MAHSQFQTNVLYRLDGNIGIGFEESPYRNTMKYIAREDKHHRFSASTLCPMFGFHEALRVFEVSSKQPNNIYTFQNSFDPKTFQNNLDLQQKLKLKFIQRKDWISNKWMNKMDFSSAFSSSMFHLRRVFPMDPASRLPSNSLTLNAKASAKAMAATVDVLNGAAMDCG